MRCGVPRPVHYDPDSRQTAIVDGVAWFEEIGPSLVRWTAIRKGANIELAVPRSYEGQGGFLVELGTAIKQTIP